MGIPSEDIECQHHFLRQCQRSLLNHFLLESASSLTLSIFYFISIWMSFSGEEYTESGWFYLAAFACFANFVLYAADFAIYLRRWMIERRDA
ncbi:hypothetical protein COOONC_10928, partial [Cooperia oncophora]